MHDGPRDIDETAGCTGFAERPEFACYDEPSGGGPSTMDRLTMRNDAVESVKITTRLICPMCGEPIARDEDGIILGGRAVHRTHAVRMPDPEIVHRAMNRVPPDPEPIWRSCVSLGLHPHDPLIARVVHRLWFAARQRQVAVSLDIGDARALLEAAGILITEGL